MTEESKTKMSVARMGYVVSPETCAKLSVKAMGNTRALGYHHTDETRMKISVTSKGKKMSSEACVKMSVAKIGKIGPLCPNWKGGWVETKRRSTLKRRLLGFNPLNSWFPGCDGHHINPNDVIHIPHKLHKSIFHNQYTGKGMVQMNALAGAFLTEDWT